MSERDAWAGDAERWICQIKGVLQCKIDLDEQGDVAGVHVVALMGRDPRHIVRDVESLFKARLQMDVYYKKIGVVQVLDNGELGSRTASTAANDVAAERGDRSPAEAGSGSASGGVTFHPPREADTGEQAHPQAGPDPSAGGAVPAVLIADDYTPRMICSGVSVMASERVVRAEVQLSAGEIESGGSCEGPNHGGSDIELIARAALEAVVGLLADPVMLHLREIRINPLGGADAVQVAVELLEARRAETLLGACAARHNRQQAIVHAVLDALNRRLGLFARKTEEGRG